MPDSEDTDLTLLRTLDPAADEQPPARGSARYDNILRRAMTMETATPPAATPTTTATQPRTVRFWRRPATWAAAVTVAAAVAIGAVVVTVSGDSRPASAVVLVAAETTAKVTSLRVATEVDHADGRHTSTTADVSGEDFRLVTRDGAVTITSVTVGDKYYESVTGDDTQPSTGKVTPETRLTPFNESTAAVVRAALEGGKVDDRGAEKVRGAKATHYRITMTASARDALAALPPVVTAWFELEYPQEVSAIDIWAAGDLIRKISVEQGSGRSTTEFYDFNAPVTVSVPPGF